MLVGKDFGPYHVDKELGSGAMGTVVRAKHTKSGNRVAIKLMSLALGSSENSLKRFKREVEILRQRSPILIDAVMARLVNERGLRRERDVPIERRLGVHAVVVEAGQIPAVP